MFVFLTRTERPGIADVSAVVQTTPGFGNEPSWLIAVPKSVS
jgi:hypothetical protein